MKEKSLLAYHLLLLTIVLTNLSQIPDLINNSGVKILSYLPWLLLAYVVIVESIHKRHFYLGRERYLYFLTFGYLLVCLVQELLGFDGFGVCLLRPLLMCIFIYVVSLNAAMYIDERRLIALLVAYAISSIVVTAFVYRTMLVNGFTWTSGVYAYDSKNSVSQIILTALLFLVFMHSKKNKFADALIVISIAGLALSLFMLKSRASIIGIAIIVIAVLFSKTYARSIKIIMSGVVIVFIGMLLFNVEFRVFFINDILFAGRDSDNINAISSGRFGMIQEFPSLFAKSPIFGYGKYYIECMQLDALLESGLIGGIMINIIAIAPIVYAVRSYLKYKAPIDQLLLIVSICYYINGLFEQLAPFGPGVKCYFLWLLFGFSVSWRYKKQHENTLDYKYANYISGSLFQRIGKTL